MAAFALPFGIGVAMLVVLLDYLSKQWLMGVLLNPPRRVVLAPYVALVPVWNPGISFGMLGDVGAWNAWILAGLALAVCAMLVVWLARTPRLLPQLGLGLVIGGAIGNVIDRVRYGAVFDFLDVFVGDWHWPAFNLADSAIVVGVALLLWDGLFVSGERTKQRA